VCSLWRIPIYVVCEICGFYSGEVKGRSPLKICVIGLGYVGSVAAAALASAGHDVLGVDIDRERVDAYCRGKVPFYEPGLCDIVRDGLQRRRLRFVAPGDVSGPLGEVIMIATGTPTGDGGGVDLSQVRSALAWARSRQTNGIVVMKSTVPPGTGLRLCETILSGSSLKYACNPEFLREGQAVSDWFHPDRIVIGGRCEEAVSAVKAMYAGIEAPYVITDITSAEMIKYASNAYLATRISFINEIAALCDRMGAVIDDVSEGISLDPRIGHSFLRAGVGYGGSCFPKDVRALDQLALTNDHSSELLRAVITVNNRQRLLPLYALRHRFGRLAGLRVGVLGLAFKPNTDDVRESPPIDLIRLLVEEGARVAAYDPKAMPSASKVVPEIVELVDSPYACAKESQALVLMTEWPEIVSADWPQMARLMEPPRFLFDGRNALQPSAMRSYGFEYTGVGRTHHRLNPQISQITQIGNSPQRSQSSWRN
jgi:UDPglucose 6-dehydrogenase